MFGIAGIRACNENILSGKVGHSNSGLYLALSRSCTSVVLFDHNVQDW